MEHVDTYSPRFFQGIRTKRASSNSQQPDSLRVSQKAPELKQPG
jgi:hypothetical protein